MASGNTGRLQNPSLLSPGLFSQGESLVELEGNIRDAYLLVIAETVSEPHPGVRTKEIVVEMA